MNKKITTFGSLSLFKILDELQKTNELPSKRMGIMTDLD